MSPWRNQINQKRLSCKKHFEARFVPLWIMIGCHRISQDIPVECNQILHPDPSKFKIAPIRKLVKTYSPMIITDDWRPLRMEGLYASVGNDHYSVLETQWGRGTLIK